MLQSKIKWTNPSVINISKGKDPISIIRKEAQRIIMEASDAGISGPPYDPFDIAKFMGVKVLPNHDVPDARLVQINKNTSTIEYNPNKTKGRIRFSIAHELTHLLFPDYGIKIRNREPKKNRTKDDWQLEMLCNLGASEFLMPIGSFPSLQAEEVSIGNFLNLQKQYDVSTEALFLRAVKLTKVPCCVFCATKIDPNDIEGIYGIDYLVPSKGWDLTLSKYKSVPPTSIVNQCTAVGYTVISDEIWDEETGLFHIECVGIPAYPGHRYPRVLGIITHSKPRKKKINSINYKRGDATKPTGAGNKFIAHVINDKALYWGGRGFALSLKNRYPASQKQYLHWRKQFPLEFELGNIHRATIDDISGNISVYSMIAQKGYGVSNRPRIRYSALKLCLKKIAHDALKEKASVHMPRVGCGQAGGSWHVIEELIEDELCQLGIKVFIYDIPPKDEPSIFDL